MALDARHRTSIYQKLLPILGDDDTNALMTEYPSIEGDELVTKQFLRAELALTRGDLRAELAELRDALRGEIADIRTGMAALETRLMVRMGAAMVAQTTLLVALLR